MPATPEATERYVRRYPEQQSAMFFRTAMGLHVSSLGIGTYLGACTANVDRGYVEALVLAAEGGINFFDTAINYRNQQSERCIASALSRLRREEIVVCTKAGFLTPGAIPDFLQPQDILGDNQCFSPEFLGNQIDRSRANLGVDSIDVFYLHNPDTLLSHVSLPEFELRMRRAFSGLEKLVGQRKISWYGVATWDGFRKRNGLSLRRLVQIAREEGGVGHHFRFIQAPLKTEITEAPANEPESVVATAARLRIIVVASATLNRGRILGQVSEDMKRHFQDLSTDAQCAIQFTRSTPGIVVALVGMSQCTHVRDNLRIAKVAPMPREEYSSFYKLASRAG